MPLPCPLSSGDYKVDDAVGLARRERPGDLQAPRAVDANAMHRVLSGWGGLAV